MNWRHQLANLEGEESAAEWRSPDRRHAGATRGQPAASMVHSISEHARLRALQRGLSQEDLDFVARNGTLYRGADADYLFLRALDLPQGERREKARLIGTALVVSKDGAVITVWRNARNGLRNIRQKVQLPSWAERERSGRGALL